MKKAVYASLIIVLILFPFSIITTNADAENTIGLRFFEVIPTGDFEGLTLLNYGIETDLKSYTISDGEGNITFSENKILGQGEKITLLKAEPDEWYKKEPYIILGTEGTKSKNFTLNDDGDDIYLIKEGTTIDTFVFGNITTKEGWSGDSFDDIPKYSYAVRKSVFDTDSAKDWKITIPGRVDRIQVADGYLSTVEPFVFPESSGAPVFNALEKAKTEIVISVYTISHPDIISLLVSLKEKGVSITVLVEGAPAGGVPRSEIGMLALMNDAGIDVRIMTADDGFRRYTYLHNKYAVIDSKTVIITSENWAESSFEGNRGWGAVIENGEYAGYMHDIFAEDSSVDNCDIKSFRECYPTSIAEMVTAYIDTTEETDLRFSADVFPILSPDYSFTALKDLISKAKEKVYSEQLEVQYSWTLTETDSPVNWMIHAASKGVDTRLIVDVTFDNADDQSIQDGYGVYAALKDVADFYVMTIKGGDDFSLTHNKGMIIDDSVWLGSINWTYNSFNNNREIAVLIVSDEMTSFYESYFLEDWGDTFVGEISLDIRINDSMPIEGRAFILDATDSNTPEGLNFGWDLDGDNLIDRWGERIPIQLSEGDHDIVLIVTDNFGNKYSMEYSIRVGAAEKTTPDIPVYMKYIPLLVICVIVLAVKCIMWLRGR
ncbi:MAG: phospholipase D-like domain-containing protein [Candidatus Methanomethylophilaceae archaeon]